MKDQPLRKRQRKMRGRTGPALLIQALRAEGFEVKVQVWRIYERPIHSVHDGKHRDSYFGNAENAAELGYDRSHLSPRGGAHFVSIWHPQGEVGGNGSATCNAEDNFDRRRGLRMALGRAVKNLEGNEAKKLRGEPYP
jgi:hypothetical protein